MPINFWCLDNLWLMITLFLTSENCDFCLKAFLQYIYIYTLVWPGSLLPGDLRVCVWGGEGECSGVARAFPGGWLALLEGQNDEEKIGKNERKHRKMRKNWGNVLILPTREWEAIYGPGGVTEIIPQNAIIRNDFTHFSDWYVGDFSSTWTCYQYMYTRNTFAMFLNSVKINTRKNCPFYRMVNC